MTITIAWIAVLLLLVTSTGLLIVRDWRWSLILLAVQYVGVFVLTLQHWPLGMASVKLVAGWMSAAILGMTRSSFPSREIEEQIIWPRGRLFRLFAAAIILLLVRVATPAVDTIMADAGYAITGGSLILIGMGLLHLGISSYILRVVIGLMTVLSGFEILYSAVEGSILVAALLATINLGLALVGAYLMIAQYNAREAEVRNRMNAPTIWIIFPIIIGALLLFITNQRALSILGGIIGLLLAAIAQFIPIETAMNIGGISLKIASTVTLLGRSLVIQPTEGALLTIIYGGVALWFFGAEAADAANRLVPFGFMITGLMVASIAVEPFLYAALFIQMAILLAIPLMTSMYEAPSKGITRFLVYQTLAMPFILVAGWLLGGVEASPGDLALATQSASMLGLGFAFLLAIFPLFTWIPMLAEEVSPYILAFILWILPTVTIIFCAGFIDRYSFIRSSPQLISALRLAGLVMLVTGGIFAAFQRNLARIMSYGAIAETGFSMLALSLDVKVGVPVLFLLIPARALGLAVWSLSVTVIKGQVETLYFGAVQGVLRILPFAGTGMIIAALSTSTFPLLAGFPGRLALWENLARVSLGAALWMGIGIIGLLTSTIRSLAAISMAEEYTSWKPGESLAQRIMLGLGVIGLFVLGIFPQTIQYFLTALPLMFEHLGR